MRVINFPINKNIRLLALGAESAGVFAVYQNGKIFISQNFGDLLNENNFLKYQKAVLGCFKKRIPDRIITDLHPLYNSTIFAEKLAKKFKVKLVNVQHHLAHIFSAVGDRLLLPTTNYQLPTNFIGIASDGTGYGLDGNIWGGEIFNFQFSIFNFQKYSVKRIGSLEEQVMIGGDLAVKEPARMLIAILAKISARGGSATGGKNHKNYIYSFVKRYYTRNEFELLYNQLEQNFNCQKTTSTGRILDAVSLLLGFSGNERKYKHEAVKLLEKNSTIPYDDLGARIMNYESRKIVNTTYLFEYLVKNIRKDKKRLAATAQEYIAKGLYEIINLQPTTYNLQPVFFAGGMANNKIISEYLEKRGVYTSKKIPRGDEGIAFGQIVYYLFNND